MFTLTLTDQVAATIADLERRDQRKHRKVVRCLAKLEENPNHPGLMSHKYETIRNLSLKQEPIWESYVENHSPSAWRVWWFYGPDDGEITVVDMGPHP